MLLFCEMCTIRCLNCLRDGSLLVLISNPGVLSSARLDGALDISDALITRRCALAIGVPYVAGPRCSVRCVLPRQLMWFGSNERLPVASAHGRTVALLIYGVEARSWCACRPWGRNVAAGDGSEGRLQVPVVLYEHLLRKVDICILSKRFEERYELLILIEAAHRYSDRILQAAQRRFEA